MEKIRQKLFIPRIGLGTFGLKENSVSEAIRAGYRLLDTAWQYGNEKEVGNAVKNSGIGREEFCITTKLWTEDIRKGRVREELEESLRNLQTEYVDLYLIHWPAAGFEKAWETMAQMRMEGKIRAIGISNFEAHHIEALEKVSGIVPLLNQVECHPCFRNDKVTGYCKSRGILSQAWCPLGGPHSKMTEKPVFRELSLKYGKTPAQVILRWHLQRGMLVIPRSSDSKRQRENLDILDFVLEQRDMEAINRMDTGYRIGADPDKFDF